MRDLKRTTSNNNDNFNEFLMFSSRIIIFDASVKGGFLLLMKNINEGLPKDPFD